MLNFKKLAKNATSSVILSLPFISGWANAANYQGIITNIMPAYGKVYVVVGNGFYDGSASVCPFDNSMVYWIDPATPFGRSLLAVALSAKLSGKIVYAGGDATCVLGVPYRAGAKGEGLVALDFRS